MAFTAKAIKAARAKRDKAHGPLAAFQTNVPALKPGPKNSAPTKAGSKRSVKANRDSTNTLKGPRKASTTKSVQAGTYFSPKGSAQISATPGVSNISNNRGAAKRSSRLNYSFLRRMGKK